MEVEPALYTNIVRIWIGSMPVLKVNPGNCVAKRNPTHRNPVLNQPDESGGMSDMVCLAWLRCGILKWFAQSSLKLDPWLKVNLGKHVSDRTASHQANQMEIAGQLTWCGWCGSSVSSRAELTQVLGDWILSHQAFQLCAQSESMLALSV